MMHPSAKLFLTSLIIPPSTSFILPLSSVTRPQTTLYSINISEKAPRNTAPLLQWSSDVGIQYDLQLTSSDKEEGVYAIASRELQPDTCILYVPYETMLIGRGSDNSAIDSEDIPAYSLFLQLLLEYQNSQSPYYTYLDSLPRYYTNGASMTDFCFGCLPPYAAGLALSEKNRLKNFMNALDYETALSYEVKSDKDLLRWAYNVVYTRCQEIPGGELGLIPIVDYLNHGGVYSNAYLTYDESGNCYVYTSCEIGAGEAITICYGDPTNPSALLARYGFLDESSDGTFCKYVIDNPSEEVCNLGYPSEMLFYRDGSISQQVWDVILYQELGKVSDAKGFYQACIMGDEGTKNAYHEQYWSVTLDALRRHVGYLVNELDELEIGLVTQLDIGQDAARHPRLPLLTRHNEFVKDIFDSVEKSLDNMMFS